MIAFPAPGVIRLGLAHLLSTSMSVKPPRSRHRRKNWQKPKQHTVHRRTDLRSIGFSEAQVGRTERKLITHTIVGNSVEAQLVRALIANDTARRRELVKQLG